MRITPLSLLPALQATAMAQIETTFQGKAIAAAGFGEELRRVGDCIARNAAGGIFGVICEALESVGLTIDDGGCIVRVDGGNLAEQPSRVG